MPLQVIRMAATLAPHGALGGALVDAAILGFYFMLRGGEYLRTSTLSSHPIRLCQVQFKTHTGPALWAWQAPLPSLLECSYGSITFVTQKNGHKGAAILHHVSGDPLLCPVRALQRRVQHLRSNGAPSDTPLLATLDSSSWVLPTSTQLTTLLRSAVSHLPNLSYLPSDVSPRSLRSGGAMALLLAGEDKMVIQMVGRWKSDALFTYLHSTALPLVKRHAFQMLHHGKFTIMNTNLTLQQATDILGDEFIHDDPPSEVA